MTEAGNDPWVEAIDAELHDLLLIAQDGKTPARMEIRTWEKIGALCDEQATILGLYRSD